jgi:hypothetical protein
LVLWALGPFGLWVVASAGGRQRARSLPHECSRHPARHTGIAHR